MTAGALGQAVTMVLYGLAREPATALVASLIAGASWIAALATLGVSAQIALPDWVRARGLALYTTIFFGSLTLGSAVWGEVAEWVGLPVALYLAAGGATIAIPMTWRWKLQTGAGVDLTPSMHWPAPITAQAIAHDRGPVLVTVEYQIRPQDRAAFLRALDRLEHQRRRDGAYAWSVFEDAAVEGRILETFLVEFVDRAFTPARTRHQCRSRRAAGRAALSPARCAESDAFHRGRRLSALSGQHLLIRSLDRAITFASFIILKDLKWRMFPRRYLMKPAFCNTFFASKSQRIFHEVHLRISS